MKKSLQITPEILYDEDGKEAGALLKIKDFDRLVSMLEDLKDNLIVYKRTMGEEVVGRPADEVWKKVLGD